MGELAGWHCGEGAETNIPGLAGARPPGKGVAAPSTKGRRPKRFACPASCFTVGRRFVCRGCCSSVASR